VSLLVWTLPFDLSGMGGPAGSYTTAGLALRVTEPREPPPPQPRQGGDTFGGIHTYYLEEILSLKG
jgi:hypothetical protein